MPHDTFRAVRRPSMHLPHQAGSANIPRSPENRLPNANPPFKVGSVPFVTCEVARGVFFMIRPPPGYIYPLAHN